MVQFAPLNSSGMPLSHYLSLGQRVLFFFGEHLSHNRIRLSSGRGQTLGLEVIIGIFLVLMWTMALGDKLTFPRKPGFIIKEPFS